MRRLKLFLVACALFFVGAVTVLAESANFIDNGKYLFKNIGSRRYLGPANSWGTQASLIESSHFNTVHYMSDGVYTIESQVSMGSTDYYFNGSFMDSGDRAWVTISKIGDNIYTMSNGSTYYGYDGSSTVLASDLTDPTNVNTQWEIISVNDDAAVAIALGKATLYNPIDATFLILDPNFDRNHRSVPAWNMTANYKNLSGGNDTNRCAESWHSTFTLSQTISNVPNGMYKLTAQGFYRQDAYDNENLPVFHINGEKQSFPIISGSENTMADASVSFSAGKYTIEPIEVTVTDNTITLGAMLENNTELWCIWDNFQLLYYGTGEEMDETEAIRELKEILEKSIQDALSELDGKIPTALYDEFEQQMSTLNTNYTTSDEYREAIDHVSEIKARYSNIIKPYMEYLVVKNLVLSVLEQKDAYTDVSGAENSIQSEMALIENSMNNIEAIQESITTLRQSLCDFLGKVNIHRGKSIDLTSLIQNQGMDALDGWQGSTPTIKWGGVSFSNAEFYNIDFDIYQTLSNMPKGNYLLKVQAFQRPGSNDVAYSDYLTGVDNVNSFIYINDGEAKIKNVMSEYSDTCLLRVSTAGGSYLGDYAWPNGKGYTPNGMEGARLYFDKGYYDNEVLVNIPEGDLRFGFRCANHANSAWTLFDNFRLYYFGSAIDVELNENKDFAVLSDIENANITMRLSVIPNEWNGLVLPFDVSEEQVKNSFGEDAVIATLTDIDNEVVVFSASETGISANVPFLLRTSMVKEDSLFLFDGCHIVQSDNYSTSGSNFEFVGNYQSNRIVSQGYFFSGNKLTSISESNIKSFHSYIRKKDNTIVPELLFTTDGLDPKRIDETELMVLKQAYDSCGGDNWNRKWLIWDGATNARNFPGIKASNGKVTSIDLSSNNLSGDFPYVLLSLPSLTDLNLSANSLSGDIGIGMAAYQQIAQTTEIALKELNISDNQLSGNVGAFAHFYPNLESLNASGNNISDVIPMIAPEVSVDLSAQSLPLVGDLHLADISPEALAQTLPSVLFYNHEEQAYNDELSVVCSQIESELVDEDSWYVVLDYADGETDIPFVSEQNVYNGQSGDVLYMETLDGTTFSVHLLFDEGDANFDGLVDVLDLQTDINYIFENYKDRAFNFTAANLWADEQINVQDVICQVNLLMSMQADEEEQPEENRQYAPSKNYSADTSLFVQDGKLLLYSERPVAAFDVVVSGVNEMIVSKQLEQMGFTCVMKKVHDGIRLIGYSMTGASLPVGDIQMASVKSASMASVRKAMLSDIEANAVSVQTNAVTTGMTGIVDNPFADTPVYDLQGRKANGHMSKGLYIQNGHKIVK